MHSVCTLVVSFPLAAAMLAAPDPATAPPPNREAIEAMLAARGIERPAPDQIKTIEQRVTHAQIGADGRYVPREATLIREFTEDDFRELEQLGGAEVIPYHYSGDSASRFDLVIVGDGYRGVDAQTFLDHLDNVLPAFMDASPFRQYLNSINIWAVRAGSQQSGVDHDPVFPIWRTTSVDMFFWCDNFESLLCVHVIKLYGAASRASSAEFIVGMANSTKYGGAVYGGSDVVTLAGGNDASADLLLTQFAVEFANLRYESSSSLPYSGAEPPFPNITTFDAATLAAIQWKWHRWLGVNDPEHGGLHSTFAGALGYGSGIYRATADSRMRTAGEPFNLPAAEAIILELYRHMKPIHSVSPPSTASLVGTETLEVIVVQPESWSAEIAWFIDGAQLPGQSGPTLDLASVKPAVGSVITVRVVDPCPLVRDEAMRARRMTTERSWTVAGPPCNGNTNGDTTVDLNDVAAVLENWLVDYSPSIGPGDANADGIVDFNDVVSILANWLRDCP